jgi:hypothetical protein
MLAPPQSFQSLPPAGLIVASADAGDFVVLDKVKSLHLFLLRERCFL